MAPFRHAMNAASVKTSADLCRFVHQHDEEFDSLKKARRKGRPASTKEDLLKLKIAALEAEYKRGFGMS